MKVECPVCYKQSYAMQTNVNKGICEVCSDIIEFGYPSFPAYRLEENTAVIHQHHNRYSRQEKAAVS